jgi:hypothetical protein
MTPRPIDPGGGRSVPRHALPVVVPANCDTSPRSVGQRFRPATTCAAPDVIADVNAHTPLTAALRPHTHDAHTPPGRGGPGRADRERTTKRIKQANVAGTGVARPARTGTATECSHRSPVSAGKSSTVRVDMLNPQCRASRLRAGSACCHRRPRGCFGSRRGVPSGSSARSNASHARLRKRSVGRRSSREPVDLCLRGFQFTSVGQPAGRRDGYGCERSARARVVPITA